MLLPYFLRLVCLCLAAFTVIYYGATLLFWAAVPRALRFAQDARPGFAARFLFLFRIFPLIATTLAIAAFCVPSYLWLEPHVASERVGLVCLCAALIGAGMLLMALFRGGQALLRTRQYVGSCIRESKDVVIAGEHQPMLVLGQSAPVMAIAGLVRPRLVVSERILETLSPDQLDAALRHEVAHRAARDNWKRLLFVTAPVVPFVSAFRRIERQWAKYAEWAADDGAVAGNLDRAISLAGALVSVARLGVGQQHSYLLSSLVTQDDDLQARVDRLLGNQQYDERPAAARFTLWRKIMLATAGLAVLIMFCPGSLNSVHQALETLIR